MTATLADLRNAKTVGQIFQTLLGVYQAKGFPTQSWQDGGVDRTRLEALATALADLVTNYIVKITDGGFLDYATGAWLEMLAAQTYSLTRHPAVFTVGNIVLTGVSGVQPATYPAGQLIAVFGLTGRRYFNAAPVFVPKGPGSMVVPFRAEFAGASYADQSNSGSLTLATPIPGVTLSNPSRTYTAVAHIGAGTGGLTVTGSPVGPHSVVVVITSTGMTGTASWSYSLDGAPYISAGAADTLSNVGGTGINITLDNGLSGISFVKDDTYIFNTPDSWITSPGADAETDAALRNRCRNRWASLSAIPTIGAYELLATSVPGVGAQVTQVLVETDPRINNRVNIVIAGPAGALPMSVISAVQSFISQRVPATDRPVVLSPSPLNVALAGIVTVKGSQLGAAQAAIRTALTNYINNVGINGTIRIAAIIDEIMDAPGAVDVSGLTINGGSTNLTLGSPATFIVPSLQSINLSYVTTT